MHIILITGAFGFVGTNLSAWLARRGFELWALDVPAAQPAVPSVYARRFTWNDLAAIPWSQVDGIVHLAGKAHDTRNTSDAQSYFEINAGLTRKVLAAWQGGKGPCAHETATAPAPGAEITAAGSHMARRVFILFSSVKAVADQVEGVLTEEAEPNPQTPYGQSKREAEDVVRQHEQAGFYPYILRPCMIHGPGNKGNLNLLFQVAARGVPWPLGAYENRRSFASIDNVCAVVEGLLTANAPAGAYQVADDEALSTNMLIRMMAEEEERKPRILKVPPVVIRSLARVGDVLRLPLNSERLSKLTESYEVSNAKIKRALGWERMPVTAREGLRATLRAMGGGES